MSGTAWGKAKHQVYVLSADIIVLDDQGENLEAIFQKLKADNGLSVGKSTFKRHAKEILKNALATSPTPHKPQSNPSLPPKAPSTEPSPDPKQNPSQAPRYQSTGKKAAPNKFNHNPSATDKDLW